MSILPPMPKKASVVVKCLSVDCSKLGNYSRGYCYDCVNMGKRYSTAPINSVDSANERAIISDYVIRTLKDRDIDLSESARSVLIGKAMAAYNGNLDMAAKGKKSLTRIAGDWESMQERVDAEIILLVGTSTHWGMRRTNEKRITLMPKDAEKPLTRNEVRETRERCRLGLANQSERQAQREQRAIGMYIVRYDGNLQCADALRDYLATIGRALEMDDTTGYHYVSIPSSFDIGLVRKKIKELLDK